MKAEFPTMNAFLDKAHAFGPDFVQWAGSADVDAPPPNVDTTTWDKCVDALCKNPSGLAPGLMFETMAGVYGAHTQCRTATAREKMLSYWEKAIKAYLGHKDGHTALFTSLATQAREQKARLLMVHSRYYLADHQQAEHQRIVEEAMRIMESCSASFGNLRGSAVLDLQNAQQEINAVQWLSSGSSRTAEVQVRVWQISSPAHL